MRIMRTRAAALVAGVGLALSLAACGEAGSGGDEATDVEAEEVEEGKFDEGTRMAELAEAGKITVGVRYDQPGLGYKDASSDIPTGFDVEIAKLLVADLGIDPEDTDAVTWEETISDNREPYLQEGRVDLVLAHQLGGLAGAHVGLGRHQRVGRELAHPARRLRAVGHRADDDVAIGDEADGLAVLDDRDDARILIAHDARGVLHRGIRVERAGIRGHHVAQLH